MATEFDQLREELEQESVPHAVGTRPSLSEKNLGDYAAWRLRKAWSDSGTLGPDHAVLFRQVLRWNGDRAFASLPNEPLQFNKKCGITRKVDGVTAAEPFSPGWLDESLPTGLDPKPCWRRPDERFLAEGYLGELQYKNWASPAQREAVWLALKAPPRSTSLIALPTGAGKSLCFQALARFGKGLTVVVVPTVALAHDHLRSAAERFPADSGVKPRAFSADENAQSVLEAVKSRSCRLLFTSPEACVSGRLKTILETAANEGWFENLVIDEAHLVETWGMDFRPDFQMLSALRRTWLSEPHSKLRTTLLSATFTEDCLDTLKKLYWDEGSSWKELVSQRLRPEITYFKQKFTSSEERDSALLECLWNLPRPAIVYTTKVEEAERLYRQFKEEGFRRLGCFTGETGRRDRGQLLDDWHSDRIDLMVATSAFGLGVDKPDVRSVVHACMPENLHRYYQEVGRGGRDGMSSVALLLEASNDRRVAMGLAPRLLRPKTLQGRWEGMWSGSVQPDEAEDAHKVYLDSRPANLFATETYKEHIRWNKRLLGQLLRAELIELLGYDVEYAPDDLDEAENRETCTIRFREGFAPGSPLIGAKIEEGRTEELRIANDGLTQLLDYLDKRRCMSFYLADLYGRDETIRVCGGCHGCRSQNTQNGRRLPHMPVPASPRTQPRLTVVTNAPLLESRPQAFARRLVKSWNRFACKESDRKAWIELFSSVDPQSRHVYRMDKLSDTNRFHLKRDEQLVILHDKELYRPALDLRVGEHVIHVFANEPLDANGRYPLESEGAQLITNWRDLTRVH